jgi:hypothetical protein
MARTAARHERNLRSVPVAANNNPNKREPIQPAQFAPRGHDHPIYCVLNDVFFAVDELGHGDFFDLWVDLVIAMSGLPDIALGQCPARILRE